MYLEKVLLINFKNYSRQELRLGKSFNCIVGANGTGKTNLLDSIYYLSLTKSAFNNIDYQNISHEQDFFTIKGWWRIKKEKFEIQCTVKKGQKKLFKVNGKEYEKLSHHIGAFPLIIVAPNEGDLITGLSESRRKFIDTIISQVDPKYLDSLLKYNRILRQRNAWLRQSGESGKTNQVLTSIFDEQLLPAADYLFQSRRNFIAKFDPYLQQNYRTITNGKEGISMQYKSDLSEDNFEQKFFNNIDRDVLLERTELGIHRDDLKIFIDDYPARKYGSQGQQKSILIALKLAQFDFIKQAKDFSPILLLDDIFDKLDDARIHSLVDILHTDHYGQILITDAREERTLRFLKETKVEANIFRIISNQVVPEN